MRVHLRIASNSSEAVVIDLGGKSCGILSVSICRSWCVLVIVILHRFDKRRSGNARRGSNETVVKELYQVDKMRELSSVFEGKSSLCRNYSKCDNQH